jgi:hypothetical protein
VETAAKVPVPALQQLPVVPVKTPVKVRVGLNQPKPTVILQVENSKAKLFVLKIPSLFLNTAPCSGVFFRIDLQRNKTIINELIENNIDLIQNTCIIDTLNFKFTQANHH